MTNKEIFFLYSPIHLILAYVTIRELGLTDVRFIISTQLSEALLFQNMRDELKVEATLIPFMGSNKNVIIRAVALIFGILRVSTLRCDRFWTANELSPYSYYLKRRKRYRRLGILDEGMLRNVVAKERVMTRYHRKRRVRKTLMVGGDVRFKNRKITDAVLFSPEDSSFERLRSMPVSILDAAALMSKYDAELGAIFEREVTESLLEFPREDQRCLLLTSPLSENRNSAYFGQELDIIRQLLTNNPSTTFFLKLHYREEKKKYDELIREFNNLAYPVHLQDVPAQYLSSSFELVCGFHSSALEHALGKSIVFTLSEHVKSQHSAIFLENVSPEVRRVAQTFELGFYK